MENVTDFDRLTKATRRREFDDGLMDYVFGGTFLLIGILGWFFFSSFGLRWFIGSLLKSREPLRAARRRPEHQRRVERQRRKAVRRDPDRPLRRRQELAAPGRRGGAVAPPVVAVSRLARPAPGGWPGRGRPVRGGGSRRAAARRRGGRFPPCRRLLRHEIQYTTGITFRLCWVW